MSSGVDEARGAKDPKSARNGPMQDANEWHARAARRRIGSRRVGLRHAEVEVLDVSTTSSFSSYKQGSTRMLSIEYRSHLNNPNMMNS